MQEEVQTKAPLTAEGQVACSAKLFEIFRFVGDVTRVFVIFIVCVRAFPSLRPRCCVTAFLWSVRFGHLLLCTAVNDRTCVVRLPQVFCLK